jgi:RNA polymerase sigma-70 factor (ECF subfamily)
MNAPEGEITRLLARIAAGDREAEARLIPLVYDELRRLAGAYMRSERGEHTLQATALVHEAFLRLTGNLDIEWQSRAHFFAVAARTMRRILVDHARGIRSQKRQGIREKLPLESAIMFVDAQSEDLLALDLALERLAAWDPRQCRVVELKFFGGLTMEEIAAVLGVSKRTATRDFDMARAWLHGQLATRTQDECGNLGSS